MTDALHPKSDPQNESLFMRAPFSLLLVRGAPLAGYQIIDGLGMGGKHLDTLTLSESRNSDEVGIGFARTNTIISGRHLVRQFLEGRPLFARKVMKLFGKLDVSAAFVSEHAFGFARYEKGERIRHRVFVDDSFLYDEGAMFDFEAVPDAQAKFDKHGDEISEEHEYGVQNCARLMSLFFENAGLTNYRDVEMDIYEGPPPFVSRGAGD